MPTDLEVAFARRRVAKTESDAHMSLGLVCVGIVLTVLVLLFVNDGIAQAVEWMGEIEF